MFECNARMMATCKFRNAYARAIQSLSHRFVAVTYAFDPSRSSQLKVAYQRNSFNHQTRTISTKHQSVCNNVDDVQSLVSRMYSSQLWRELCASSNSSPLSDTVFHSRTTAASTAHAATATSHLPPLLHVTSLLQHPAFHPHHYYTLAVTPAQAPRHPLDRFALNFSRSLSHTVLLSGRILREEPRLRYQFDLNFKPGLEQLRHLYHRPPLPHIAILTQGRVTHGVNTAPPSIDFRHPIFDAVNEQQITIYFSQPRYGRTIREQLGAYATTVASSKDGSDDAFEASLESLVSIHSSGTHAAAAALQFPQKRIRFQRCSPQTTAARVHIRDICEQIQKDVQRQQQQQQDGSDKLSFVSIEAGPQTTNALYGNFIASYPIPDSPPLRPYPVHLLLITVFRPDPTENPNQWKNLIIDPAAALPHRPTSSRRPHSSDFALLPPSMTDDYLNAFYERVSEHQCLEDRRWTFYCYRLKQQFL